MKEQVPNEMRKEKILWSHQRKKVESQLFPGQAVQSPEGLIHEKERRIVDQDPTDGHALLYSPGQLVGPIALKAFQDLFRSHPVPHQGADDSQGDGDLQADKEKGKGKGEAGVSGDPPGCLFGVGSKNPRTTRKARLSIQKGNGSLLRTTLLRPKTRAE